MSAEAEDLAATQQVQPASPAAAAAAAPASASPRPAAAAPTLVFTANGSPPAASPDVDAATDGTPTSSSHQSNPQLVALRKIDALSEKLQKEGKLLESLQCSEKGLILRGHIFGLDSVEVMRACKSVGEMCNYLSMSFLQQDLFDVCLELLKKAEVLTERHKGVRAVTLNNLACYYRKRGKLRTALNYARKALGIEAKLSDNVKSADTHLNMCTILSELQRHEKAIVHARIALKLLLMELFGDFDSLQKQQQQEQAEQQQAEEHELIATGASEAAKSDPASLEALKQRLPHDRVAVLAIAYFNKGVQEEFLRRYAESLLSYEKACKVAQTHLPPTHPLVQTLGASYDAARKKMEHKIAKQNQQAGARETAGAKTTTAKQPAAAASKAADQRQAQNPPSVSQPLAAAAPSSSAADGGAAAEVESADLLVQDQSSTLCCRGCVCDDSPFARGVDISPSDQRNRGCQTGKGDRKGGDRGRPVCVVVRRS